MPPVPSPILAALVEAAHATPGLELLLLFGSRARGDAPPASDWDFGYIAAREVDAPGLLARIVEAVGSDHVDLVDLHAAGGMLRYRAARDGLAVFEAEPARADRFRIDAARFWYDAEPVLKRGYETVLAELKP
jgi:predicted nucleotidyltransferase